MKQVKALPKVLPANMQQIKIDRQDARMSTQKAYYEPEELVQVRHWGEHRLQRPRRAPSVLAWTEW
jgi:hypothetical protein